MRRQCNGSGAGESRGPRRGRHSGLGPGAVRARTRRGREWLGYEGNLHCALIVEPDYPNEETWQLVYVSALAAGSAIAEMVSPMTGLRFAWPNRLLLSLPAMIMAEDTY